MNPFDEVFSEQQAAPPPQANPFDTVYATKDAGQTQKGNNPFDTVFEGDQAKAGNPFDQVYGADGQTLTDYGVTLRKALDRAGAGMGYGLQKLGLDETGQTIRDFYHEREATAPPQSESFKAQEATPWTEAIKHPVTAAGKLAGDVLSAAPEMALATAATMATGGFGLPGIAGAAAGGAAGGAAFGLSGAERAAHEIETMPEEQLRQTPAFAEAYARTDPGLPEADRMAQARQHVADVVARATMGANVGVGTAVGPFGALAGRVAEKALPSLAGRAAAGAVEGGAFMGGTQAAENAVRQGYVDPNVSITAGVPDAVVGGTVFGGAHGLVKGGKPNEQPAGSEAATPGPQGKAPSYDLERLNATSFPGATEGNRLSADQLGNFMATTQAGQALGQTIADLRAAGHDALADKLQITSSNAGEHVPNSRHYQGLAVDINTKGLTADEQATVAQFAQQNGLVRDVAGEPWHFSYRGGQGQQQAPQVSQDAQGASRPAPSEQPGPAQVAAEAVGAPDLAPFLSKVAKAESGGDATAQAGTSSAFGLGQFTGATRQAILDKYGVDAWSKDPGQQMQALAYLARDNRDALANAVGRAPSQITDGELYMAHLLGQTGGQRFLAGLRANPDDPAINHVAPEAVRANKSIFLDPKDGRPRTLAEVYDRMAAKVGPGTVQDVQRAPLRAAGKDLPQEPTDTVNAAPDASLEARPDSPRPEETEPFPPQQGASSEKLTAEDITGRPWEELVEVAKDAGIPSPEKMPKADLAEALAALGDRLQRNPEGGFLAVLPDRPKPAPGTVDDPQAFGMQMMQGLDLAGFDAKRLGRSTEQDLQRLAGGTRGGITDTLMAPVLLSDTKDSPAARMLNKALLVYRDSRINPAKEQAFREWAAQKLADPWTKSADRMRITDQLAVADAAANLTPEQKAYADVVLDQHFRAIGDKAREIGAIGEPLDHYVRRIWDLKNGEKGTGLGGTGLKTYTSASRQRSLETVFDGWMQGHDLKLQGVSHSLESIAGEINRIAATKQFIREGKSLKAADGRPVFTTRKLDGYVKLNDPNFTAWAWAGDVKALTGERSRGGAPDLEVDQFGRKVFITPPKDLPYGQQATVLEQRPLYAPKAVADVLNKMTVREGAFDRIPLLRGMLELGARVKSIVLASSFFHHFAMSRSWIFGVHHGGDMNIGRIAREGLRKILDNDPIVRLGAKNGLTLGINQEYGEIAGKRGLFERTFRGLGLTRIAKLAERGREWREGATNYLFNQLMPGLKARAFELDFMKELAKNPDQNHDALATRIARLVNEDFGGLHLQRMGRNPTLQNVARLLLLAPDWTESNTRSFLGAIAPKDAINRGIDRLIGAIPPPEGMAPVYRQFWGRVLYRTIAATAIANLAVNGWRQEDRDAYLKFLKNQLLNWETASRLRWTGVYLDPLYRVLGIDTGGEHRVFALAGHLTDPLRMLMNPSDFIKGKGSPIMKYADSLLTGTDWADRPFSSVGELVATGQTIKGSRYEAKEPFFSRFPSTVASDLLSSIPIQMGHLVKGVTGEEDWPTAIAQSSGLAVNKAWDPNWKGLYGRERKDLTDAYGRALAGGKLGPKEEAAFSAKVQDYNTRALATMRENTLDPSEAPHLLHPDWRNRMLLSSLRESSPAVSAYTDATDTIHQATQTLAALDGQQAQAWAAEHRKELFFAPGARAVDRRIHALVDQMADVRQDRQLPQAVRDQRLSELTRQVEAEAKGLGDAYQAGSPTPEIIARGARAEVQTLRDQIKDLRQEGRAQEAQQIIKSTDFAWKDGQMKGLESTLRQASQEREKVANSRLSEAEKQKRRAFLDSKEAYFYRMFADRVAKRYGAVQFNPQ